MKPAGPKTLSNPAKTPQPDAAPRLYEALAERLILAIDAGSLKVGDRMPSVRGLSAREGVSISTVLATYRHLETIGLIEAKPQSGHFVRKRYTTAPAEPGVSVTAQAPTLVGVGTLVQRVYATLGDKRFIPLGSVAVAASLLPARRLGRLTAALARDPVLSGVEYGAPPGCRELRAQIARRSVAWGCAMSPDEIIITCGATEAVMLSLLAVARPGDAVAIESPTFYGMLQAIESTGLRALEIPTHPRTGMDLDALESSLRRHRVGAILVVPNFSNPLGSLMPDDAKRRLVQIAVRRKIPVIEDDVYGELHFSPARPRLIRAFDGDGLVLSCGSFSKTLAPGFRVGWVAPGRFHDKVLMTKYSHTLTAPTLPQRVLAEFLESAGYDRHLRTLRRCVATQMEQSIGAITRYFPAGTRVTQPAGGAVLWVSLPRRVDSLELHRCALRERISIAPGPIFSPKQKYRNFIRISCGYPWSPAIEAAFARLGQLARDLAQV